MAMISISCNQNRCYIIRYGKDNSTLLEKNNFSASEVNDLMAIYKSVYYFYYYKRNQLTQSVFCLFHWSFSNYCQRQKSCRSNK